MFVHSWGAGVVPIHIVPPWYSTYSRCSINFLNEIKLVKRMFLKIPVTARGDVKYTKIHTYSL